MGKGSQLIFLATGIRMTGRCPLIRCRQRSFINYTPVFSRSHSATDFDHLSIDYISRIEVVEPFFGARDILLPSPSHFF